MKINIESYKNERKDERTKVSKKERNSKFEDRKEKNKNHQPEVWVWAFVISKGDVESEE